MPIFVAIPQGDDARRKLPDAVKSAYPNAHYALENNTWLVAGTGTVQDVTAKLKIVEKDQRAAGPTGTVVVLEVASYYGRASIELWTWVKSNWEATGG